jgi:hypothetical protein
MSEDMGQKLRAIPLGRQRQPEMMSIRLRRIRNSFQEPAGQLLAADGLVADRENDLVGDTGPEPMRDQGDHERRCHERGRLKTARHLLLRRRIRCQQIRHAKRRRDAFRQSHRKVSALRYQVRDRGYRRLQQPVSVILDEKQSILVDDVRNHFSALGTERCRGRIVQCRNEIERPATGAGRFFT